MAYSFKKLGNLIVVALKSLGSFFKCKESHTFNLSIKFEVSISCRGVTTF